MDKADRGITGDYDTYISRALATEGGHLSIGRGGFSLYFARGAHLSGYDCEPVKAACIAAGLPVIDSRMVDFAAVAQLAIKGPMIAVVASALPLAFLRASRRRGGVIPCRRRGGVEPGPGTVNGRRRARGRRGFCDGFEGREKGSGRPVSETPHG
jgi:hypothetical protein